MILVFVWFSLFQYGQYLTPMMLFHWQISKIKQMMLPDSKDGPVRPVIRTFYDHVQVLVNWFFRSMLNANHSHGYEK